jgi:Dna[CI] antecedent DciA-like protein
MAFEGFQQFIPRAASKYGVRREIDAAKICHDFRTLIPTLFEGKKTPEKFINAAHFKDNALTVEVDSSAWAQEVVMRKPKIIAEMNLKAGREVIKTLHTQLKK